MTVSIFSAYWKFYEKKHILYSKKQHWIKNGNMLTL